MYINDLTDCAKNPRTGRVEAVILLYADDVACWGSRTGAQGTHDLNKVLARVQSWANDWRLAFNTTKSQVVAFSNLHFSCEDIPVRLGPAVLSYVDCYHYLGLTFHASLRWHAHFRKVISKVSKTSAFICSWFTADGPSFDVVRALVLAVTLPQVAYGFPIWRCPSHAQARRLENVLLQPLRRCLGLPPSTHGLSVLAECGLPTLEVLHQEHQLQWLSRISDLPQEHPSQALLAPPAVHGHASYRPALGKEALSTSSEWAPARSDARSMRVLSLQRSLSVLHDCKSGRRFQALKRKPGISAYLVYNTRPTAALRARLRLDRSYLNESKARRGWADTELCSDCPNLPESLEHVLLHCPTFAHSRGVCEMTFAQLGIPFSTASILDAEPFDDLPAAARDAALHASSRLLYAINQLRPL